MVQFFNCFEVPAGREEEFFGLWKEVNAYMVTKPGYVSHSLHRSAGAGARFAFVNHGVWQSAQHWAAAHDEGFRAPVARPEWSPFTSVPGLYDVVHSGSVEHVTAGSSSADSGQLSDVRPTT